MQRWGRPRITLDVDLTLLTPLGAEAQAIARVPGEFPARIPDAGAFAQKHRVILARTASGVPLDDWGLIESELTPLLELREAPERLEALRGLRRKVEGSA